MFIILATYKVAIEKIDEFLAAHRAYLDVGYQQDYLIVSGPQNPRTGGVLISQLKDRDVLEKFLASDPFKLQDIADYQIIEFNPVKYHERFASFM